LVLVDTGLRALELCSLKVGDVEIKRGKVEVKHGFEGGAKGGKGRMVYLGKVADGSCGVTWLNGKMGRTPMHRYSRSLAIASSNPTSCVCWSSASLNEPA